MSENGMFGGKGSGDTSGFGGLVNSATVIAATQRPYGGYFDQVADDLERAYPLFSDAIEKVVVDRGELTLFIKAARLVDVARLTRILMPDDWSGFPQRKDYPLGGIEIEYKGATVPAPSQRRSYK